MQINDRCGNKLAAVLTLLYECTPWTLLNVRRKSLTEITQECWELYWTTRRGNTPKRAAVRPPTPITKTIQIRQTRHARHCWKSKDELMSDVQRWTLSHSWTKVGRPVRTYVQQLCVDTGCILEDLMGAMDDRDRWRQKIREIRASSTTWWHSNNLNHLTLCKQMVVSK